MFCRKCKSSCIKNGFQANGKQRYYCRSCKSHQQKTYTYRAYGKGINRAICRLLVNSCGITDIARVLHISKNTVSRRILDMAARIKRPVHNESNQTYEMDELFTKVWGRQCWVSYAINRSTRQVMDFAVGKRSRDNLGTVINTLLGLKPNRICTDRLPQYKSLVPDSIHCSARYRTNRIERLNLNIRNHLKRLSRRTLCYSKSAIMLEATLRIYFWGHTLSFA